MTTITKESANAQQVGKLYFSRSGWLLLNVPNAVVHGLFASLDEPGIERPVSDTTGRLEAHISVMRPEELEQIGGAHKVSERGRDFRYVLGRVKEIVPAGWAEMSKAWIIPVRSLELEQLRKSYGLPPLPKYPFHLTIAVRRKKVLQNNAIGKGGDAVHIHNDGRGAAGGAGNRQADNQHGSGVQMQYTGAVGPGKSYLGQFGSKAASDDDTPSSAMAAILAKSADSYESDPHSSDADWWNLLDSLGGHTKSAVTIPGIPNIHDMGDLSKVQAGQLLDFVIQKHIARRAGEHFDVRFGDPNMGAFSWATKKEMPDAKKRIALFQQPKHAFGYMPFEGTLHGGYGAGTVRTHRKGKILITKATPTKISFTMAGQRYPERFALIKPRSFEDKAWLLVNTTPIEATPYNKVHYTKIPQEQVGAALEKLQEGSSVQAKMDGALTLTKLLENGVEVMSYRVAKETGRPLIHSERVFHGRPEIQIPKELVGTVLKGELYGTRETSTDGAAGVDIGLGESADGGRHTSLGAIPPQELGGILNATVANSIEKQKAQKVKLKQMLFDIQQLGKTPVTEEIPYADRMAMLRKVLPHLPSDVFHLPEEATTPGAAQALWQQITEGKHPLTQEGIVIHPPTGIPSKAKLLEEQDVFIRDIFPGEGKYEGQGAGGFRYSTEPEGPILGRVGTGLSDELRKELLADPAAFIGRVAKVRSQGPFPSGALRAPALHALHEDPVKAASFVKWADEEDCDFKKVAASIFSPWLEKRAGSA
jgi:hypothetical protein